MTIWFNKPLCFCNMHLTVVYFNSVHIGLRNINNASIWSKQIIHNKPSLLVISCLVSTLEKILRFNTLYKLKVVLEERKKHVDIVLILVWLCKQNSGILSLVYYGKLFITSIWRYTKNYLQVHVIKVQLILINTFFNCQFVRNILVKFLLRGKNLMIFNGLLNIFKDKLCWLPFRIFTAFIN